MLHSAQTSVSYKSDYRLNFGSGFHQRKMVLNNACLAVKKQFSVMLSRTRFAGFIEILLERYQVLYIRINDIIIIFGMKCLPVTSCCIFRIVANEG